MLNDIYEIDQATLADVYDFTIDSKGNTIVFGASGIGKTEMAIQAAQRKGFKKFGEPGGYYYLNLSVLESVDLTGLPKIENNLTTFCPPDFLPFLDKDKPKQKPSILIVDEIDKASDELQNPCLELFQFRSVNGKKLNIDAIIATGNLPDERAKSRALSHALTNRCMIYKVAHEFEPWLKWAKDNNLNPLVISFLFRNQEYLLKPNESGDPTGYCHPSPRSWTLAARDLDKVTASSQDDLTGFKFLLVASRVGLSAATKFKIWLRHHAQIGPHIDELVNNGTHPTNDDMDFIMVCATSCLQRLNNACLKGDVKAIDSISNNIFSWLRDKVTPDLCLASVKSALHMPYVEEYDLLSIQAVAQTFDKVGDAIGIL